MTLADVLALLGETTLAASAALLLVLALRRPLRRQFGATLGYALWALVPAAILAVLLPAATVAPAAIGTVAGVVVVAPTLAAPAAARFDPSAWLFAGWLAGALLTALRFAAQQRAFRRRLGRLSACADGTWRAEGCDGLPAVIGLWRPRIVLPGDLEQRYDEEQRRLVQAHERMHIRRGDLQVNAFAAVLRCVFWFNPLLHLAVRRFRHDQELACDQRVVARHPQSRRAYGEAMFKTQLAAQPLPLGCHWGFSHPLTERIAMLKQPVPGPMRWLAGAALVTALTGLVGVSAWAAQPPAPARASADLAPPPPPAPPAPAPDAPPPPEAPPAPPAGAAPVALPAPPAPPPPPALPKGDRAAPTAPQSGGHTQLPAPRYPKAALDQRIEGRVLLIVDVDAQGKATAVTVDHAEPAGVFEEAAAEAARRWTFTPAIENGRPVASRVRVPIDFEMTPPETQGTDGAMNWVELSPRTVADVREVSCDAVRVDSGKRSFCGNRD